MFDTLLSNKNMKEQLSRAIIEDKPLQAYMFCGEEGSGKKTAALAFASLLVGDSGGKALRGNHPDVIFLRPEEDKRIISVEQVRGMRQDAFVSPTEGKRKVYIIDGPLQDEGQNALLTILEQPPSFQLQAQNVPDTVQGTVDAVVNYKSPFLSYCLSESAISE